VAEVVEWIVDDTIGRLSINLTPELDPITEPSVLRRSDGTSVYRHTGRDHYTSRGVLEAEQRIVEAAGRPPGIAWSADDVELSVLAAILAGVSLNRRQQDMVTARRPAARACNSPSRRPGRARQRRCGCWRTCGPRVATMRSGSRRPRQPLRRSPRRPECRARHSPRSSTTFHHDADSSLVTIIGPGTLVVIDEAGMADTLTLAAVIEYAVARGSTVRLIGDDRQLAAIGAGGVLRDIAATPGAVRLHELVRFADPAEAEASLALREGDQSALGFYLDNDRVHVGNADRSVDEVFDASQRERAGGRDCLMLGRRVSSSGS
jgi:hypothetical protein